LRIETTCGKFELGRYGIRFVGPPAAGPKFVGLVGGRGGRLNFYERGGVRWRSQLKHRWGAGGPSDGRALAFLSSRGRLYITDLVRAERPVGVRFEYPLGWTRAGLLLTARRNVLRARTRSGKLVGIVERRAGTSSLDPESRTLLYVSRNGGLIRTDGRRSVTLVGRGLRRFVGIWSLSDGRVGLTDRRLTVLKGDGSFMASDRLRGNLAAVVGRDVIATVSTGPLDTRSRSTESVRLLLPGRRSSDLLFTTKVGALGCGHWPTLTWNEDELLYTTSEGHVVVASPASRARLDLTSVVKRLPGRLLEARWS
jgi:hypothetical protein